MAKKKLRWSFPTVDPQDIADRYVELISGAPGVLKVWAEVEGYRLAIYTLVRSELTLEEEDRVFEAEAETYQLCEDAPVDIRVLLEGDWLPPALGEMQVFYAASGPITTNAIAGSALIPS